jgi:hypothetical protein
MANRLTIRKLALIFASTAMASAIHTGAQAAQQIDCNSFLTQLAIKNAQGDGDVGVPQIYAHCVPGALAVTPTFTSQEATTPVGVAGRPATGQATLGPWPRQDYVTE